MVKTDSPFISKSKYLIGLQCEKLLWFSYNQKDVIPEPSASTQAIFDQGHEVGELAKRLYPDGIEVAAGIRDFEQVLAASAEAIKHRKPLFEAAFMYKSAYARADILNPVGRNEWDIIEVKSSTEVKDINLHDLALQRYAYEGAGLSIHKCYLMHVNKGYTRHGKINPAAFFTLADVTNDVSRLAPFVEGKLVRMTKVILRKECPDDSIGPRCRAPYACPLEELCWDFLPEDNIFTLSRLGRRAFDLLSKGIYSLSDLPDGYRLTSGQTIQRNAVLSGKPHIDKLEIRRFLSHLKYPVHYMDFETFRTAIPLLDGVKPYQQIPFQFSVHVVDTRDGKPRGHAFLADGSDDPRPDFLRRLKETLGPHGSIVCYNAPFELSRLRESAGAFPEYAAWIETIKPRLVDLYAPFRSFHYYHPDQKGSASIKAVLPVLTSVSYSDLPIADGNTASLEFLRTTFGEVSETERHQIRKQLEEYCGLDTLGMTKIVDELAALVNSNR